MNFSDIKESISKIDSSIKELKEMVLAEIAIHRQPESLFDIWKVCGEMEIKVGSLNNILQDVDTEVQEKRREQWEEEECQMEIEYYLQEAQNV